MPFDRADRLRTLEDVAAGYVTVALRSIALEYPHMPYFVATGPASYRTHRELHPAFYGCFDWHSCVEMQWAIVRLLRTFPALTNSAEARAMLDSLLTVKALEAEVDFFADVNHRSLERPYGWGWLLTFAHELETWDDPDARRWATAVGPLAEFLSDRLVAWLPLLSYPQRTGMHPNTAFSLSRALDIAQNRARRGSSALRTAIVESAQRFYESDTDYPVRYEPSGADFLSPALCEAELISRLLPGDSFPDWLTAFLPGAAFAEPMSLFSPAAVSDSTDGQIAHLHGLNLSRAWAFTALAGRLPLEDPRVAIFLEAAERHAEASLPAVSGSDYMVEHWLAAYATLLLSS